MTYNGYVGIVVYDCSAGTFTSGVTNANVLVSFRGDSVKGLKASFHAVVDAYLEDCRKNGIDPEQPCNGTLTVRVDPEVHRKVAPKALQKNVSMNRYVEGLLRKDLDDGGPERIVAARRGSHRVGIRAGSRRVDRRA